MGLIRRRGLRWFGVWAVDRARVLPANEWENVDAFYAAHPGSPWDGEYDCYVHWRDPDDEAPWRITVAIGAGLAFAVCSADGRVRLLATNIHDHEVAAVVLDHLPTPDSLP